MTYITYQYIFSPSILSTFYYLYPSYEIYLSTTYITGKYSVSVIVKLLYE